MRAKVATFTGIEILVVTVAIVQSAVAGSHEPLVSLVIPIGYFVTLGLIGIGAAAAVATGMRAGIHQTLTVVFVTLSLVGVWISAVTLLFQAIGLFNLGPASLDLWPRRWRRGAEPPGASSNR